MVSPLVLAPVFEIGKSLLDRWFPDAEERAKAEREFMLAMGEREMRVVLAQLEINAREAAHPSRWTSGWRPYFGWIGGTAFLYVGLIKPILHWVALIKNWPVPPDVDTEFLWVVVSGLLGISSLRSFEKSKGVAK